MCVLGVDQYTGAKMGFARSHGEHTAHTVQGIISGAKKFFLKIPALPDLCDFFYII